MLIWKETYFGSPATWSLARTAMVAMSQPIV